MRKIKFKKLLISIVVISVIIIAVFIIKQKLIHDEIKKAESLEADINKELEKESDILVLVNNDNKIPDNYKVNLVEFKNHYISSYMKKDLEKMFYVAKLQNVELVINNSYRSRKNQVKIFNSRVKELENEGYSYINAYNEVRKTVNLPGYSEHETGLAIDFSTNNYEKNLKMWSWLKENSYKYGFILRYPKDKEKITEISYEEWHYRYVGKEVARYMYHNDLCLEEYLNN